MTTISPKFYRGKIMEAQFKELSKNCPRMTQEVEDIMRLFFVEGTKLSHLGVSKQAAHQRAKYYMHKGVELGIFETMANY
tara:strand:+ start:266 stop:505 length:240 start_codon:yes stop_codon:yes gene_type:complete